MKKKLVAIAAVAMITLSACGGGGGRPSVDDISKSLKSSDSPFGQMTTDASDDVIDCIAKALHDSDLSDGALQALVDNDKDFKGSDDDEKAVQDISSDLATCATS
jgi:hypothetical protein